MSPAPGSTVADLQQVIADLRRELAQCRTERDEALAQQTATAEVLRVINASPGDLAPVFDAMLGKAMQLCGAAFGMLSLIDGDQTRTVATRGVPAAYAEFRRSNPPLPTSPISARVRAGEPFIHNVDLKAEEFYERGDPQRRALVDIGGARTSLVTTLMKDHAVLGSIHIYRTEVRPFSNQQIALLQNFAAQAVIAMENARLITETREALEQQTATAEVLGVINSSPGDLTPVFDAILQKAHSLCDTAQGGLALYDGQRFRAVAMHGYPDTVTEALRLPFAANPVVQRLLDGETYVHVPDFRVEASQTKDHVLQTMIEAGVRTWLGIPLRKDGAFLGHITASRNEVHPFTDKQIALLQNFAAQAVIAMENARLLGELREALEQQTATAEVLGVINSSPGDLAPVFDAILEKAHSLCGADRGGLILRDGERFRAVALQSIPEGFANLLHAGFEPRPKSPIGRLMGGERQIHILDLAEFAQDGPDDPVRRASVDLGGTRTLLMVPLRKDEALFGVIAAMRQEVRPFTEKQIALLQNFAAQAVIAIENARLITETREALEQQTATAEVLGVINSSPGDLAPVFDAMLEKALTLCEAPFGILHTYDGERFRVPAWRGASDTFIEFLNTQGGSPGRHTGLGRIIAGERIVHVPDIAADVAYSAGDPLRVATVDLLGARTCVWVGLFKDGALLGVLTLYRPEVRPFTDKQIALLQNFAAQAVIAMENARLITETREALEQQTATAEVLQVINSSPGDLVPVFDAILEKAHSLCGAELGRLFTFNGEIFWPVAAHGLSQRLPVPTEWMQEGFRPAPGNPFVSVLEGAQIVHIADIRQVADQFPNDPGLRTAVENGLRTFLVMPLRKDDVLLGVITAVRREVRPFSDKQIALLENFADQAVIAMENARLLGELRERTSDLQESLEYQTATSDVLQVISQSGVELEPVLETLVETAVRICEAEKGMIFRLRDGQYHLAASVGFSTEFKEHHARHPTSPGQGTVTGRVAFERGVVHMEDAATDSEYIAWKSQELGQTRTMQGVPLFRDQAVTGVITLSRSRVEPFTNKQIELVRTFADQAVIAMENARLLGELRQRTEEVRELNRGLEARVAEQVDELGRVGRLKRFLAPQLAEMIVSQGDEQILESHRREIVVVFCDLRGYTAFIETAEPEEVLDFLREYHGALGPLVSQFEGTLDQFSGDGIMVFFNDPVPCPDPAERAVKMAMAMREAAGKLIATWRRDGCELGFGSGIAQGYATLGQIGFSERSGYTAIGTVCNLAARLCAEAKDGQILISSRVARAVEAVARLEDLGNLELKGLRRPVAAFNVVPSASQAGARPNLSVVARDPEA